MSVSVASSSSGSVDNVRPFIGTGTIDDPIVVDIDDNVIVVDGSGDSFAGSSVVDGVGSGVADDPICIETVASEPFPSCLSVFSGLSTAELQTVLCVRLHNAAVMCGIPFGRCEICRPVSDPSVDFPWLSVLDEPMVCRHCLAKRMIELFMYVLYYVGEYFSGIPGDVIMKMVVYYRELHIASNNTKASIVMCNRTSDRFWDTRNRFLVVNYLSRLRNVITYLYMNYVKNTEPPVTSIDSSWNGTNPVYRRDWEVTSPVDVTINDTFVDDYTGVYIPMWLDGPDWLVLSDSEIEDDDSDYVNEDDSDMEVDN